MRLVQKKEKQNTSLVQSSEHEMVLQLEAAWVEVKQRQSDDTDGVLVPTGPLQQLTQCQCVTNTPGPWSLRLSPFVKLLLFVNFHAADKWIQREENTRITPRAALRKIAKAFPLNNLDFVFYIHAFSISNGFLPEWLFLFWKAKRILKKTHEHTGTHTRLNRGIKP